MAEETTETADTRGTPGGGTETTTTTETKSEAFDSENLEVEEKTAAPEANGI